MTLTPSAFSVTNSTGGDTIDPAFVGTSTPLTVTVVQLDSSNNVIGPGQVRGGSAISVALTKSNPSLGTIASSITFHGGDTSTTTPFQATATGTTTVTASAAGFSAGPGVTIHIQSAGLVCNGGTTITVGNKLETPVNCTLQGATPSGAVTVMLTSNNSSLVQFSTSPTGAGSGSISVTTTFNTFTGQWNSTTPTFYVYGLGSSGVVGYTAAASGYSTYNGSVAPAPSGFVLGTSTPGQGFTTILDGASTINVWSYALDSSGEILQTQALAGGQPSVTLTVSNSNSNAREH